MQAAHELRSPCANCGGTTGSVKRKGLQDTVRCRCGKYQYNAPRRETGASPVSVTSGRAEIKPKQRARIVTRARGCCELCGSREFIQVGHIVSVKIGTAFGMTPEELNDDENLTALCAECNLGMGAEPISLPLARSIVRARIAWRENS